MHERLRRAGEPESRRPDASGAWRPPVPAALTAQAVLALQRSAGNACLAPRLARQASATMPPSLDEAPAPGEGLHFLTEKWQERLRLEAAGFIPLAYASFNKACAEHAAALKAAASASADWLALLIGIVAGPLAPFLAKWTGRAGEALAGRLGLAAATRPDVKAALESHKFLEAAFAGATSVGLQEIKDVGILLPGETGTDAYLDSLSDAFDRGAHTIIGHLHDMTDLELVAVWIAYSYEHTSLGVYREAIGDVLRQFDRYVADQQATAIGAELTPGGDVDAAVEDVTLMAYGARQRQRRVYMADLHGRPRAILVLRDDKDVEPPRFRGYVPKAVEAAAKARTVELFGTVETIDPNLLYGGIPDPPGTPSLFHPSEPDEPAGAW